jgi:hypothetical protein
MMAANYPSDIDILLARPVELSIPFAFPLEYFAEVVLVNLHTNLLVGGSASLHPTTLRSVSLPLGTPIPMIL